MKSFKLLILIMLLSLAMLEAKADSTLISDLVALDGNVTDVDSNAVTGLALTAVDASNGTWYYTTDGTTWKAVGSVAENNALLLAADAKTRLDFQPNANFNGSVTNAISFRAWDQTSGTASSKVDTSTNGGTTAFSSEIDTANITVTAVNDAPIAEDKTVTTDEDTSVSDVLSATDIDGDSLTYSLVSDGSNGTAVITSTGDFTYTPNADFNGTDSFTYKVNDGTVDSNTATVTVTVTAVNDVPSISGTPAISVDEDTDYTFTPTASDVEGDTLTFSITNKPSWADFSTSTGQLSGTPENSDVDTTDNIVITVSDDTLSADLPAFNLTVNNTNDAPVLGETSDLKLDAVPEDTGAPSAN
ncbi:MAG: Ig-like domain-containing protein [Pseudomonadota bacterium]